MRRQQGSFRQAHCTSLAASLTDTTSATSLEVYPDPTHHAGQVGDVPAPYPVRAVSPEARQSPRFLLESLDLT
jgi:hypothetical protein